MPHPPDEAERDEIELVEALRDAGARFAFVHGSRADGSARADSDLDVGAWFGTTDPPAPWEVAVPDGVDLVVLDRAPLILAGRIACHGRLLFDDDPRARVEWVATTRKIYADERPRLDLARRTFLEERARGR